MIPNNQLDADTRFRKLVEAVKFVWASTYFRGAKAYRATVDAGSRQEKMAVLLQEVVGLRHGDRFYPDLSGVARSYGFYRFGSARARGRRRAPRARPREDDRGRRGDLELLARPSACAAAVRLDRRPPQETQTEFWAVNMGKPPAYDPVRETEYLVRGSLVDAEEDGTLRFTASTWDAAVGSSRRRARA